MRIVEPFNALIIKDDDNNYVFLLKLEDKNTYIICGTKKIVEFEEDEIKDMHKDPNFYGETIGDNDIANLLIMYHNWYIDMMINNFKSTGKAGKHKEYLDTMKARIDNNVDTEKYNMDEIIIHKFFKENIIENDILSTRDMLQYITKLVIRKYGILARKQKD